MRAASRDSLILNDKTTRVVVLIALLAFAARLGIRLASGGASFQDGGYDFYADIARNVLDGHGFCWDADRRCALRVPVYPSLLVPFLLAGGLFPALIVVQAALGALLAWVAFILGRRLFDAATGLIAALLTAVSPYALVHDTALQETVVVNLLVALAAWLFVVWVDRRRSWMLILGGAVLALATLTTARVAFTAPAVIAWLWVSQRGQWRARVISCVWVALPVTLLVGAWMMRNWAVVGAPVLTTESGVSLWIAQNPETFTYFPGRSVDLIPSAAMEHLTEAQIRAYAELSDEPVAQDAVARRWAVDYMSTHPGAVITGGIRKVWVVISAELSPTRSSVSSIAYRAIYGIAHLFAVVGIWRSRHAWRRHGAVHAVLLAFFVTTAMFWAHTSHKSLIDVFLFVYAASAVSPSISRRFEAVAASGTLVAQAAAVPRRM